jgi:hypothetical protein
MQRDYWWAFWRKSKGGSWLMAGTVGFLAVLALLISIGSAAGSNQPGYVGWGCCCGLPFLLLAAPYAWRLHSLAERDRQNANLGVVELVDDVEPDVSPSSPANRLYIPKPPK